MIILVDLSHIFWSSWHASAGKPVDHPFELTLGRVRQLAGDARSGVAICCDSGRSFRSDLLPEYKANRPQKDAAAIEQLRRVIDALRVDGYPILAAEGFEADDVIATAVKALANDHEITIATNDKDMLQLVTPRVRVRSTQSGDVLGPDEVRAKIGVPPMFVGDWLALVGDTSDNIKGAPGIGPKTATKLLADYGDLDAIFVVADTHGSALTPAVRVALIDHREQIKLARRLVTLRTDAPIDCAPILRERIAERIVEYNDDCDGDDDRIGRASRNPMKHGEVYTQGSGGAPNRTAQGDEREAVRPAGAASAPAPRSGNGHIGAPVAAPPPREVSASVVASTDTQRGAIVLDRTDPRWKLALDPASMTDAQTLAKWAVNSRLFSAFGSPEQTLMAIMMGRSMGLDAITALRTIHVIEGKPAMSAQLMLGVVLASGVCEFFELIESTWRSATYETKRKGARRSVTMVYTIEDADRAGLCRIVDGNPVAVSRNGNPLNWQKDPGAMCMARSSSRLCRAVYPDVMANVYTPEELRDGEGREVVEDLKVEATR